MHPSKGDFRGGLRGFLGFEVFLALQMVEKAVGQVVWKFRMAALTFSTV
jgi:hypothetical protein